MQPHDKATATSTIAVPCRWHRVGIDLTGPPIYSCGPRAKYRIRYQRQWACSAVLNFFRLCTLCRLWHRLGRSDQGTLPSEFSTGVKGAYSGSPPCLKQRPAPSAQQAAFTNHTSISSTAVAIRFRPANSTRLLLFFSFLPEFHRPLSPHSPYPSSIDTATHPAAGAFLQFCFHC